MRRPRGKVASEKAQRTIVESDEENCTRITAKMDKVIEDVYDLEDLPRIVLRELLF
jgi:hypothetical protein